ncbi:hypothetical protein UFOVP607_40 [uncultured Caudovirales phage]|uniref:Uncharacterized protein n=1 Tax=uncultured Caudovirales phage TaxID=2100421 RepID=A0A6J5N2N0_9CAUD|nr:hypothetical protein UFOVP607_40 [uncultured Caudovirales phage]
MTESEKRAYLARVKYTPPAKPDEKAAMPDFMRDLFKGKK